MAIKILILNGPNLNMQGKRNPAVHGTETLQQIIVGLRSPCKELGCTIIAEQSNEEGVLINHIQQACQNGFRGIVFNPGGYGHSSVALRDAVEIARDLGVPTIEVHISNPTEREDFRKVFILSAEPSVVMDRVMSHGAMGYSIALTKLVHYIAVHLTDKK